VATEIWREGRREVTLIKFVDMKRTMEFIWQVGKYDIQQKNSM
jgi:hypothetical protein